MYLVEVQLKLEEIDFHVNSSDIEAYESVRDYMEAHYIRQYSSTVVLTDEAAASINDGPFADNVFEVGDNYLAFEAVAEKFELVDTELRENGYTSVYFQLSFRFDVSVRAESGEEAKNICLTELPRMIKVEEGSSQEFCDFYDFSVTRVLVSE